MHEVIETSLLRVYIRWFVSSVLACAFNLQDVEDYTNVYVDKERVALLSAPDVNNISQIDVEMYCVSRIGTDLPDVGRFVVPPENYADILEFFQEPKLDIYPNYALREIGMIKITTKDKSVIHIAYYDRTAMGKLHFSILGARLTGGKKVRGQIDQAMTLDMQLRRIYRQVTGHIVDPEDLPTHPAARQEGKAKSRSQHP